MSHRVNRPVFLRQIAIHHDTAADLLLLLYHNNIIETPEPPVLTDTFFLGRDVLLSLSNRSLLWCRFSFWACDLRGKMRGLGGEPVPEAEDD